MNRNAQRVLSRVNAAWGKAVYGMQKMEQSAVVRPTDGYEIFRIDPNASNEVVKMNVGPVVFNVPERANRGRSDLFIVVDGWLTFEGDFSSTVPLKTQNYGTNIAYFKQKAADLEHVYGAHYDMDESRFGHPVFHAQMGSQIEMASAVRERYHLELNVVPKMGTILGNVRTPSAQMDVFAVMLQICADHLVGQDSADEVRKAFSELRSASDFLVGAAHRLAYLNQQIPANCYQSRHWYGSPQANAVVA